MSYMYVGSEDRRLNFEDEDDLLQYAIQQSLVDAGSERDEVFITLRISCYYIFFYKCMAF